MVLFFALVVLFVGRKVLLQVELVLFYGRMAAVDWMIVEHFWPPMKELRRVDPLAREFEDAVIQEILYVLHMADELGVLVEDVLGAEAVEAVFVA